jgi:hypothetical protein
MLQLRSAAFFPVPVLPESCETVYPPMKRDKGTPQLGTADQLNVLLIQIYPHSVASDDITRLEMPREVPVTI